MLGAAASTGIHPAPAPYPLTERSGSCIVAAMKTSEEFLERLRERTQTHLRQLGEESAELFGEVTELGAVGGQIYTRLAHQFNMDGAQEAAITLVALFAGELDDGALTFTDRTFRALQLVEAEFRTSLPERHAAAVRSLLADFR